MPRSPAPTSHDVARVAGVSQPTVSRALRGDPRLSDETRLRVQRAARELNYVPSQRGRSLATRSAGQVGIVVSDLGNPFYLQVLDTLEEELRPAGLRLIVLTSEDDAQLPPAALVDGSVDGVVLTTTRWRSSLPATLTERAVPFVMLHREDGARSGDACVADGAAGARLAAQELLALGHRRVAAVFGPETTSTGREREAAFRQVLAGAGVDLPPERWRRARDSFGDGYRCALELRESAPTALFCATDVQALGAHNALAGLGMRFPRDMTLVGFDDIPLAGWEVFQLTTVSQDIPAMVRTAAELLLDRIAALRQDGAWLPARRIVLDVELVRRATHGPPPQA